MTEPSAGAEMSSVFGRVIANLTQRIRGKNMAYMEIDNLISTSLTAFATDMLDRRWFGKEHDWVNQYAFNYLLSQCAPTSPFREPGQLGIEVQVGQPPGFYSKPAAQRDIVIWPQSGMSCWGEDWQPIHHPMVILEWKVHRLGHRNREQPHEREWLRRYTSWQKSPVAYAVEVDLGMSPAILTCCRYQAGIEQSGWLKLKGRGRLG